MVSHLLNVFSLEGQLNTSPQKAHILTTLKIYKYLKCLSLSLAQASPLSTNTILQPEVESAFIETEMLQKRVPIPGLHSNTKVTWLSNVLRTQVTRLLILLFHSFLIILSCSQSTPYFLKKKPETTTEPNQVSRAY